jgi:hypothetical protein
MKANRLAPELGYPEGSKLTPDISYPRTIIPKEQKPESPASKILRRLDHLALTEKYLYRTRILTGRQRASSQISRYVFEVDHLTTTPIRIGIFAGLRGDDDVGPGAVSAFLADLVAFPDLGESLRIYAYPIVSAACFETTAHSTRASHYVINQIGCKTSSSETYQIEREIFAIAFDGIITIQLDDEIENFRVDISDAHLREPLVRPILSTLKPFLPNIEYGDSDLGRSLTAGLRLKQRPVELTLRVPSSGWSGLYTVGLRMALHTAVERYRSYLTETNKTSALPIIGALQAA